MRFFRFPALCILSFAAGWWIDAGLTSAGGENRADGRRIPVVSGLEPEVASSGTSATGRLEDTRPAPVIHSIQDLLNLKIEGRGVASMARLERAVAGLSVDQMRTLGAELLQLAGTKRQPDSQLRRVATAMVKRWLPLDPAHALAFSLDFPNVIDSSGAYPFYGAMRKVFASDPVRATLLMAKPMDRELYIYARYECFQELEKMAPETALTRIAEFDAKTRNEFYGANYYGKFAGRWIQNDPHKAMEWALALPPGSTRRNMLGNMSGAWSRADAGALHSFLEQVPLTVLPAGNLRDRLMEL